GGSVLETVFPTNELSLTAFQISLAPVQSAGAASHVVAPAVEPVGLGLETLARRQGIVIGDRLPLSLGIPGVGVNLALPLALLARKLLHGPHECRHIRLELGLLTFQVA